MNSTAKFVAILVFCSVAAFCGSFTAQYLFRPNQLKPPSEQNNDTLSAKRFSLVNGSGKELAALYTTTSGYPMLELHDEENFQRVLVGFNTSNNASVIIRNGFDQAAGFSLGDSGPGLAVRDGTKKSALLSVLKTGPILQLFEGESTTNTCFFALQDGLPDIGMTSANGFLQVGIDKLLGSRLIAGQGSKGTAQSEGTFAFAVPQIGGPEAMISDSGGSVLWSGGNPGILTKRKN